MIALSHSQFDKVLQTLKVIELIIEEFKLALFEFDESNIGVLMHLN